MARTEHADYFARKWTLLLRSRVEQTTQVRGSIAVQQWLREAFYHNKPYNEIVGELLTASGDLEDNPLVNWWRQIKDQSDQVESTAQVFLGVRLQCARCHHHPFDQWSQQDYYGLAAFFSRVGRKYRQGISGQRRAHLPRARRGRPFPIRRTKRPHSADRPGRQTAATCPPMTIRAKPWFSG